MLTVSYELPLQLLTKSLALEREGLFSSPSFPCLLLVPIIGDPSRPVLVSTHEPAFIFSPHPTMAGVGGAVSGCLMLCYQPG